MPQNSNDDDDSVWIQLIDWYHDLPPYDIMLDELNEFVASNRIRLRVWACLLTLLSLQIAHYHNAKSLRNEIKTFLIENEIFYEDSNINNNVETFMTNYKCHSMVSCVDSVIRRASYGAGVFPSPLAPEEQLLESWPSSHALSSGEHVASGEADGSRRESLLDQTIITRQNSVPSLDNIDPIGVGGSSKQQQLRRQRKQRDNDYDDISGEGNDGLTTPVLRLQKASVRHKELLILNRWLQQTYPTITVRQQSCLKQTHHITTVRKLIVTLLWLRCKDYWQLSTTATNSRDLADDQELWQLLLLDGSALVSNKLDSIVYCGKQCDEADLDKDCVTPNLDDNNNIERLDELVRQIRIEQWTAWLHKDRSKNTWSLETVILSIFVPLITVEAFRMISNFLVAYKEGKCGFLTFITGTYLAPQNCKVIFDWKSPTTVSNLVTFTIKFHQRNFKPYPVTIEDQLSVHITNGTQVVPCSIEFGDLNPSLANMARVSFSPKKSGNYTINIQVGNTLTHIRGSPFTDIRFKPLCPSSRETSFVNHCSTVICTEQSFHAMVVEMRDRFGNLCDFDDEYNRNGGGGGELFDPSTEFSVTITEIITERKIDPCFYWKKQSGDSSKVALILLLESSGLYHALISYKGSLLKNGDFNIVCLTESESETVRKCTSLNHSKSHYFNAKLLPTSSSNNFYGVESAKLTKSKNVSIFISPKQLTIKEYFLKFIPKRIATFRLSPSTKFYFARNYNLSKSSSEIFSTVNFSERVSEICSKSLSSSSSELLANHQQFLIIDDGSQSPIELISPDRNIIVAIFTHFLLNKIGGSETFRDKQDFFYSEVRRYHQKHNHVPGRIHLRIDREFLLESSIRSLKSLGVGEWCKRFEIEFIDENGIDWGGVRREWYELLCKTLFDPKTSEFGESSFFMRFTSDKQGLIHPNPNSNQKLSYYEFAGRIIGKSLLDSALGSTCKCLVNARFSRSFLAQLIGLRVNYRYFEQDDPDLYMSKIKFILENDVTSLDLYFTEDEYDRKTGKLIRTFDLIANGSHIKVREDNKHQYLDALAQYRLSNCVKDQVEAVLKGLNDLIPDHLLSIFDENELELLICGAATYSLSDLRLNHVVTGATYDFQRVVDWFWRALANFSEEELARLLQFTTGCSHLPPGGFVELNPRFKITSSLSYGTLPTAHTCFNQICLPDYDSFEDFDRSIRIAITEGSEGFGLV